MIYPNFLKQGDTIGVTAPSDGCESKLDIIRMDNAKRNFINNGYNIYESKNCRTSKNGRSSDKVERAKQINEMFQNNKINAIIGLAGGEFLLEVLPYLDLKEINKNPKWIQGFSDMTGLTYLLTTNLDIATIYGENFKSFGMSEWNKALKYNIEILNGNLIEQKSFDKFESERHDKITGIEGPVLDSNVEWKNLNGEKEINIKGRIIGGCLDIILYMIGTKYDKTREFIERYKDDGIIWFFDNCELSSEAVIRAMWQFKEAGYFKYVKGVVFGRSGLESSIYDISFKEAIKESLDELNVPIILDADIGHKPPQMTIINGAISEILSKDGKGKIKFSLK